MLAALADFNLIAHEYTYDVSYGLYEVYISLATGRGWFRHTARPRENGLFQLKAGRLIDFSAELPPDVQFGLSKAGLLG